MIKLSLTDSEIGDIGEALDSPDVMESRNGSVRASAAVVEFPKSDSPRTAIQEDILAALRAGAEFRTAH